MRFFNRKQLFELLDNIHNQRYIFVVVEKIHKEVGMIRGRLFLKLFEAQSTGCGSGGCRRKQSLNGAVYF